MIKCPHCGSPDVYISGRCHGVVDRVVPDKINKDGSIEWPSYFEITRQDTEWEDEAYCGSCDKEINTYDFNK